MNEKTERSDFEAWAKGAGWPHAWGYCNTNGQSFNTVLFGPAGDARVAAALAQKGGESC
jgi:hypothetical protein